MIFVLMTLWALFMGMVARQRFGRSFGKWFAIGAALQFLVFAICLFVSIETLSRFDRPAPALFALVGGVIAMAFMFWRLKDAPPAEPARASAQGDDLRGWGGEGGALKRWIAQAGVGVWVVGFMVMGFPGGTILMASVCTNRRLDGLDWVMSVIVPGFGFVKSLVCR